MKQIVLSALALGGVVFGVAPVQANYYGGYYQTPPFVPSQYPAPRYDYPTHRQPVYRESVARGCPRVDDHGDYAAMSQINQRNHRYIRDVQRSVRPGRCEIVRVNSHGDNTYLAIDARDIRWATRREIDNYHRYR